MDSFGAGFMRQSVERGGQDGTSSRKVHERGCGILEESMELNDYLLEIACASAT